MKLTLATFQQNALSELRSNCDTAQQLCKKNQCNLAPGTLISISDDSFNEEVFADGKVYFLNTQKLGVNSNLTKNKDGREHTIYGISIHGET